MSTIKIKRSGVSAQTPSTLEHGELALNYADGKLFYKDATNAIAELSTGGGAGGGLDSAAVSAVVDETVNDPTKLTLGTNSTSVAIGSGSFSNNLGSTVSVGQNTSTGNSSVALGGYANAGDVSGGMGSVAVGNAANASGHFSTAVGRQATTSGSNSLALGYSSEAGNYGIALGDAVSGQRSIAIGALASATGDAAIHINANYNSGVGPSAGGGLVIETSAARLEYSATDKWVFNAPVTASEFKFSDGTSMTTAPTGGGAGGGLDSAAVLATVGIDSSSISLGALADPSTFPDTVAIGHKSRASGTGGAGLTVAIGYNARTSSNNSTAIGANSYAQSQSCTAIGPSTEASGQQSTAIGASCSSEAYSFAGGRNCNATGSSTVAIGNTANATAQDGIIIGSNAGTSSSKSNPYGICIGFRAGNKGFNSSAILIGKDAGYASLASMPGENSIALGVGAGVGSGENTISIGEHAGYWNTQGNFSNNAIFINASGSTGQVRKIQDHYAIDIRSNDSDGHMWFSKDSDWNFGAPVTAPEFKFSDGTSMTTAPTGGAGGGLDSAGVQLLIDDDLTGSGLESIQVGVDASATGARGVAVGPRAVASDQNNIAIGNNAGDAGSAQGTIAIGAGAKTGTQSADTASIAIGGGAGQYFQGPYTVAIGDGAGSGTGNSAGKQQSGAVAVGKDAGKFTQGENSVAIGRASGYNAQGATSVAVGMNAQNINNAVVSGTVGVGYAAGQTNQGTSATALGYQAGQTTQGSSATALGFQAGNTSQGSDCVAIGRDAAYTGQASNSVAIGRAAGYENQGTRAIAIGRQAGAANQGANNIILNATSGALNRTDQYGIDIRTSDAGSLTYDTTNDWTFGASVNVNGDVNASGDITAFSTSVSSDPRLKTDIVKIDNAVEKVQMLNGVSWDWTRGGRSAGVLSTDVAVVLPEAVTTGKIFGEDTEYDKVNYNALIGLLVEAVKELQEEVNELKNKE